jgi:hypothetical protein
MTGKTLSGQASNQRGSGVEVSRAGNGMMMLIFTITEGGYP